MKTTLTTLTLDPLHDELEQARAAFEFNKTRYEAALHAERDREAAKSDRAIRETPGNEFWAKEPTSRYSVRPYILPFGKGYGKFNPHSVEDAANHEFGQGWLAGMTAIICQRIDVEREGPSRLIWTAGHVMPGNDRDLIGSEFTARHDQTGALLGMYRIVGLALYDRKGVLAVAVGNVPDRKFSQSTYK